MKISNAHFEMAVQAFTEAQVLDGYPATNVNRDYLRAAINAIPEPDPAWVEFHAHMNLVPHFKLLYDKSEVADKEEVFATWRKDFYRP